MGTPLGPDVGGTAGDCVGEEGGRGCFVGAFSGDPVGVMMGG